MGLLRPGNEVMPGVPADVVMSLKEFITPSPMTFIKGDKVIVREFASWQVASGHSLKCRRGGSTQLLWVYPVGSWPGTVSGCHQTRLRLR